MGLSILGFSLTFWLLIAGTLAADCDNVLNLPWGKYVSTSYDEVNDVCIFGNVKFGQADRFATPKYPDAGTGDQPKIPISCREVNATERGTPGGDPPPKLQYPPIIPISQQQEDCLYLDIYVPRKVLGSSKKLPVVVWIYGGAFIFGSKNDWNLNQVPMYDGAGLIASSEYEDEPGLIFVAGNYRMGAYGWLAGDNFKSQGGVPNLGLYDQQLVLQFVQDYIGGVNGDPSQVSVWGESAGAGSIVHHLIANKGTGTLNFNTALLQSPAFQWSWDQDGTQNATYEAFAAVSNCDTSTTNYIDCLMKISDADMANNNQIFFEKTTVMTGLFPLGPAIDGELIYDLAPVAFANNRFNKGVKALIVSHVEDEVTVHGKAGFIPPYFKNEKNSTLESTFDTFLDEFLPENTTNVDTVKDNIKKFYPVDSSKYNGNQTLRVADVIRDCVFTCNTRYLFDAYSNSINVWMMQYSLFADFHAATHGSDLAPTFLNDAINTRTFLESFSDLPFYEAEPASLVLDHWRSDYQEYFTSFARTEDPMKEVSMFRHDWTPAKNNDDGELADVCNFDGFGFWTFTDTINTEPTCSFWREQATILQTSYQAQRKFLIQDSQPEFKAEL